jgi:phage shock protein E
MLNLLKNIFGNTTEVDFSELIKKGAKIIDVRTKGEYQSGHIKGSVNIPLDSLSNNTSQLKKKEIIITCCASGMRSASAKNILKSHGYTEVHNGGGWMHLQSKVV